MAALCAESTRMGGRFSRGALDALQWLTQGGPGPLTRRVAQKPVMVRAAAREIAVAEGKIYGRDSVESRYAQGGRPRVFRIAVMGPDYAAICRLRCSS